MRIDSHQHFWRYVPEEYEWIDESMSTLRRDFLPRNLQWLMRANRIDACIAVQARQSDEETRWLLELAEANDFIAGVVGWVDLRSVNLDQILSDLSNNRWLKGFRHVLQAEADDFMLEPKFIAGVSSLAEYDFSYDILVVERQLESVRSLVDRLPEIRLVIDHIAKPDILNDSWDGWADSMAALAKHPNVYCKISGMVTEANWNNWTSEIFEPYISLVLQEFGPERLMFGSDWPVCTVAASYPDVIEIVRLALSREYAGAEEYVFGATAKQFYKL